MSHVWQGMVKLGWPRDGKRLHFAGHVKKRRFIPQVTLFIHFFIKTDFI